MRIGIAVRCEICGKTKAPRGRSIPIMRHSDFCSSGSNCPGYRSEPFPGDLWPGETEEEFGYPVSSYATRGYDD